MNNKTFLIVILIAFISSNLFAQENNTPTVNLRGVIKDAETKVPITGVNIVVLDAEGKIKKGSSSDENGEFLLENIDVGRQNLRISYIGYETKFIKNLKTETARKLYLEILLSEKLSELKEVVVKAEFNKEKPQNQMATVSARTFSVEETERYAGSLGDPSRMAQNFAGVLSAGDQRNDIIIRGNSPSGLLWRLDGVPIPNPNHFGAIGSTGGPVSMLNNNLLANSDFFTGAFPAEYGDALSGVFDLNMRIGNNYERQNVFQVGFNGFELGTEGPISKKNRSSYLINYRYSTLDLMDKIGFDVAGGAVPQYQDLSFKLHFPTKKAGIFSLNAIGGKSYIFFDQQNNNDGKYNNMQGFNTGNGSEMGHISLNHKYFFKDKKSRLNSYIAISGNRVKTKVDSLEFNADRTKILNEILFFEENNAEVNLLAGTKFITKINKRNFFDLGMSFKSTKTEYFDNYLYNIDTTTSPKIYEYMNPTNIKGEYLNLFQAYAQLKHKFSDKLSAYAGLHSQYLVFNNSFSIEPRFNAEYEINKKQTISAAYGLHSKMQPGIIYFTQSFADSLNTEYVKSNTNLGFTKAQHAVIAYNNVFAPNFRFKIETYYQALSNLPARGSFSYANFGANFSLPRIDSLKNTGIGRNYGVDLTIEKFLSNNYYFLITASLFESKFKNPNTDWKNTAFNNQYILNALAGIEIPINKKIFININLKTVFAGGNPLLKIDLEKSAENNTTYYDYKNSYEERAPDYFRLDSRISVKVNGDKVSQEWALDIQNITNHKNVFNQVYYTDDDGNPAKKYNYQQGFFPMFLYRLYF